MQCPHCQHVNTETAKFCEECGTRLARTCPACGHEVSPTAKFCPECGTPLVGQSSVQNTMDAGSGLSDPRRQTLDARPVSYTPQHLAERILAEQAAMETRGSAAGERKTITALFADIKGSMNLIEDLDPEEARSLIDPTLALMMEAVHRYEGYVAQSTGDGIFALFGAPIAHEDHPQRALFAALRMQEEGK
ncbi:MAG TPA: zinc-ribbon domain-containing protein, partial [Candidatus Binatia bacterium]|nr:zinc-ribbon domain-containing protein [Candidatus Binatia bacterium]